MFRKLASLKLTFYLLAALTLVMGTGIWLSLAHPGDFKAMNLIPIQEWIPTALHQSPPVLWWFAAICALAALLGLNAFACSITRLWSRAVRTREPRHWIFFILHCLFLLVLFCHGLILFVGDKESNIELYAGQGHAMGPYTIEVETVTFVDDLKILEIPYKKRRQFMTRESIHIDKNKTRIRLSKNGAPIFSRDIQVLSPLKYRSLQVTLTEFLPPRFGINGPGILLTLTINPLNRLFFGLYAVMILSLAGFTVLTWKGRHKENIHER